MAGENPQKSQKESCAKYVCCKLLLRGSCYTCKLRRSFRTTSKPTRTHSRTGVHVHGSVSCGFIFNKRRQGKMRCLSYLCPCRQLNCGSWPEPLCSSLFCLHRSTGSRCMPGMSSTSQEQVFLCVCVWGGGGLNVVCIPRTGHRNLQLV